MSPEAASLLVQSFSYAVFASVFVLYGRDRLGSKPLGVALTALLWFHVFRYLPLQLFSAQEVGTLDISDRDRDLIAYGDLAAALFAFASIWLLHLRVSWARGFVWLTVAVLIADLIDAGIVGISGGVTETATDLSFVIVGVYVPALVITAAAIVWQLWSRRGEAL